MTLPKPTLKISLITATIAFVVGAAIIIMLSTSKPQNLNLAKNTGHLPETTNHSSNHPTTTPNNSTQQTASTNTSASTSSSSASKTQPTASTSTSTQTAAPTPTGIEIITPTPGATQDVTFPFCELDPPIGNPPPCSNYQPIEFELVETYSNSSTSPISWSSASVSSYDSTIEQPYVPDLLTINYTNNTLEIGPENGYFTGYSSIGHSFTVPITVTYQQWTYTKYVQIYISCGNSANC